MFRVPPAGRWWYVVGAPFDRGVRQQVAALQGELLCGYIMQRLVDYIQSAKQTGRTMKFDRNKRFEGASWALWEFNVYETQMNNMYWAGESAMGYSTYAVRQASDHIDVKDVLKATGPNAKRFPQQAKPWLASMSDLQNWGRGSFVLAATGAFERYTQRIVLTALLSDPAVVYGKSGAIDGANWLKIGIQVDHGKLLEGITKGEWSQKYAAIRKLFGDIPLLKHYIADLDQIRDFRNAVGHSFGRDLDGAVVSHTRAAPKMEKIKQQELIDCFKVLSESAKAIDEALLAKHIGDFEPILHFHEWLKGSGQVKARRDPTLVREYSKALGRVEGHSKGVEYAGGLIAAYDAA